MHGRIAPTLVAALLASLALSTAAAEPDGVPPGAPQVVEFDSGSWHLSGAILVEHLGRHALRGTARLEGVALLDGVIEVDLAVDGTAGYPGIFFRAQGGQEYEHIYLRPHRAGRYPDAVQYAPNIGGVGCWQLYSGPGYTAAVTLPPDEWIPLRLEFHGGRARFFVGDPSRPALVVDHLQRDPAAGAIVLNAQPPASGCFSNFRYSPVCDTDFGPAAPEDELAGAIREWKLSAAVDASRVDADTYPGREALAGLAWDEVTAETTGLVNISRRRVWRPGAADCVYARTTLRARKAGTLKLNLGYSDHVSVFLDGEPLFVGNSTYRSRDPSFIGVVGLFDSVFLPLREGENELLLIVAERFGGWGFVAQRADGALLAPGVRQLWLTEDEGLRTPESCACDPRSGILYVSNFDPGRYGGPTPEQAVSRLTADGELLEREWAADLRNPSGLLLASGRLLIVERSGIAEADLATGEIVARHLIAGGRLLNDVAADARGHIYVSDSGAGVVYRLSGEVCEAWLQGPDVGQPNGLLVDGSRLVVATNADRCLKAFDLKTGALTVLAKLPPGLLDGLAADGRGGILVSQVEGRLYRLDAAGHLSKLIDVSPAGRGLADFGYDPVHRILYAPGFGSGDLAAYELPR
jgi:sugar lactone lactonase YvrE